MSPPGASQDPEPTSPLGQSLRVATAGLRWRCDPAELGFASTAELAPQEGVSGQDDAIEALRFGLEVHAPGQNIFVRGLAGTGKSTLLQQLLRQIQPACPLVDDICYVHNFSDPKRPRLVAVPAGGGSAFRDAIDELADFIQDKLAPALSTPELIEQRAKLEREVQQAMKQIGEPFEAALGENALAIVTLQRGDAVQPAVFPVVNGKPVPPDQLPQRVAAGELDAATADAFEGKVAEFTTRFEALGRELDAVRETHRTRMRELYEGAARRLLQYMVRGIIEKFPQARVREFLDAVVEDVIERRLRGQQLEESTRRYRVNLVFEKLAEGPCRFVVENTPTLRNLLGVIDREVSPQGNVHADHMMITAGSLLRAHGGYLILEAADLLQEPGAWQVLVRTLRTGKLEIVPQDGVLLGASMSMQPEPIPVDIKVVLMGNPGLYHTLDALDPDFANLFKVLADFDSSVERTPAALRHYAGILARFVRDEGVLHFAADGVAALAEHGARIAQRRDRLTARVGRLADLAREASFLAVRRGADQVAGADVYEAVRRTKRRADLPSRKFRRLIREGIIRVQTQGFEVGQINGLAVTRSGQLSYGFPSRITATIGPGTAGAINIEREARLSGAIHTKGFYILGGLLRRLLPTRHPLAFSASIAFEQSYGGIDGDSASGAEMCCLLSALTGIPLRQDLAMTGAIDQFGNMQAIGATSEKVEGFFDTCVDAGLTGTQGVLIPKGNLVDLMLRTDVTEACDRGEFHVYAVDTIQEALEILSGQPAGSAGPDGTYPEGTMLHRAMQMAARFWRQATARQLLAAPEAGDETLEEDDSAPS